MAVKTRDQILAENSSDFPNNVTRLISPADLRGQMDDVAHSSLFPEDIPGLDVSPAYVTASFSAVTKTLAAWAEDIATDGGGGGGGDAGSEFNTVAAMLASTASAEGAGTVWRADGFRYREANPAATDHHLTTAGGVKLYVQPSDDGWYNFLAMDPARDGVTNDADKLQKLLDIRNQGVKPVQVNWIPGPSIFIPYGIYYLDAGPWGFQIKATTHIKGESYAPQNNTTGHTILKFPQDVTGFMVHHVDTFENGVEDVATGGGISSTFERLFLISNAGLGSNPAAHGIYASTTVHIRDTSIYGFRGHGLLVAGGGGRGAFWVSGTNYSGVDSFVVRGSNKSVYMLKVDPGGSIPSTSEPTHTYGIEAYPDGYSWELYYPGGPSMCTFFNVTSFYNHNCGIFIRGHDASVMSGNRVDVYANGRWGLYDDSFLGNTWVMVHSEGNGLGTRGGNPVGTSSCVRMDDGVTIDYYYAVHTATLQQLVDTVPGTDEDIWRIFVSHPWSTGGMADTQHIQWLPGQPVGTYFIGGCFWSSATPGQASARNMWLGCYAELSEGFGVLGDTSMAIGGIGNWHKGQGASYQAAAGTMTTEAGYVVDDRFNNRIAIGADTAASATNFVAYSYNAVSESLPWRFQYGSTTGDWWLDYGNSAANKPYNITSINTVNRMGTSKTQPYLLHTPYLALGGSTTTRRQTASSAKPTTGEWARGDVIWNTGATATKTAGWLVTNAGAFGSTAWTTGTNYALNAYVLSSGSKYYRCSVDPGGVTTSTVEPSHASGEVIEADGFGWTFVSLTLPEILPFGEAIDLYDHTSTGTALSLAVATHPRQIIISATISPGPFTIGVTATGAYPGAKFHITRTGGGAGICNVGTGPLKVLATNTWCQITYDGSAWILTAYGAL